MACVRRLATSLTTALLLGVLTILTGAPSFAADSPQLIASDAMDDPAIWVHPTDPTKSLLIGNDKGGGLETYDLDGHLVQRLAFGTQFWGNVDVRQGVTVGGITQDLVGVVQRGVRFYTVDPSTRQLVAATEGAVPIGVNGEGFCMYQSPTTHKVYGISITIQGVLNQFELLDADGDGLLDSTTVRSFSVGSEAEGCVADDDTGALYVSEENRALWRYSAEPSGGTTREAVDVLTSAGGHLVNDVEGVTLVDQPNGAGFVIVSAQNAVNPDASYFSVYRRDAGNDFVKTFRITNGGSSDDCDRTDGITAVTENLGPAFPRGMFVCQDNNNDLPGVAGNQDLKMVRLENVVNLDGGDEPPPPPPPPPATSVSFVAASTSNGNNTAFTVQVPASVRAGDALLLFASQGTETALTGPGTGWTQAGRVVDTGHATTIWRRVATASDPGTTVRVASGSTYTKVGLTLAAYRGTDPTDPVASVTGAGEPGTSAAHTTPVVASPTETAWRVSYWSDKNSASTRWTAPAGETVRATTAGAGGGRIGTLLTDPGAAVGSAASTGGLTATTDASASSATSWTVLLRPAGAAPPPTNQPPTARFTSECTLLACSFDGSASSDAEDSIASYAWDFGDGSQGTEATPQHTYAANGTYAVTLTVTDDDDATHSVTHSLTVDDGTTPPPAISFVAAATSNGNNTAFTAQVPASVKAGDALVLFASQGSAGALTGPGAGWTQIGRTDDGGHVTTVWRKVAVATDPGSTVRLTSGTTYLKVALTLAAYRGTSATDPVAVVAGVGEPGSTAAHSTPSVANSVNGAWRVSYWSDRNSATTRWILPGGETSRATTAGAGGGRVASLLTDAASALTAGTPAATGGLTATADAPTSTATSWTLLLRPAG